MSIETCIQMEGEESIELELSNDESVDAALRTNSAQDFDFIVDLNLVDVDDVAPPTLKLSDGKCHTSLLSSFLLTNSLYFGVNEIISFQKLVGILDNMIVVNFSRQHHRSLDSCFKSS